MKHQVTRVSEAICNRLMQEHPGWKTQSDTQLGRSLEIHLLQLEDGLRAGKLATGGAPWGKEQIAAAIHTVSLILYSTALSEEWYCFWCGHLLPEQVTNDERCSLCGNPLPNTGPNGPRRHHDRCSSQNEKTEVFE